MFGYSLTRPLHNQEYYYGIFDACELFNCPLEGWHTESGPGVYEAVSVGGLYLYTILNIVDPSICIGNSVLRGQGNGRQGRLVQVGYYHHHDENKHANKSSRYLVKAQGIKYGITPTFMAKPREGLPGSSGHMHISLATSDGKNAFYRETPDANTPYPDLEYISDFGRHFLAGILTGLPDVMPLLAPTVNSYKRLVENFWAPVTVSWGLEHRAASVRVIAPPSSSSPKATRFEIRVGGADSNAHFVLAAAVALGWRGVEKKLSIPVPPLGKGEDMGGSSDQGARLAKSLKEATETFMRQGSIAREVFGDAFVDHFGGTREHEVRLWEEAVTDW